MGYQSKFFWLPNIIFFLGTVSLFVGCGFGCWSIIYGGLKEMGWLIVVAGAASCFSLWGLAFVVKAALRYLDQSSPNA